MNEPWPDGWDPHLAAKKGAAWLDETRPGWERSVDLSVFDVDDGCRCVLGQVFAHEAEVDEAPQGYDWVCAFLNDDPMWIVEHGFFAPTADSPRPLDEAWIGLIRSRLP